MRKKLKRLIAVARADGRIVVEVVRLVWRVERRLRSSPPRALTEHLKRMQPLPSQAVTTIPLPSLDVLNDLISLSCRAQGLRPTCLRQSLVLKELLWRRAQPSRLVIGVARNGEWIESHAWVEAGAFPLAHRMTGPGPYQSLVRF